MSIVAPGSSSVGSSEQQHEYDDDNVDRGQYRMPSIESIPHTIPSRDTFLSISEHELSTATPNSLVSAASSSQHDVGDHHHQRTTMTSSSSSPPPPPPTQEGSPASIPPFSPSSGTAAVLVTPEQQQKQKQPHHDIGRPTTHQETMMNISYDSLDITVIRTDDDNNGRGQQTPKGRNNNNQYDINYASTETFPTSNAQQQQHEFSPSPQPPPPLRFNHSTDTIPMSNITTPFPCSTVTEGSTHTASDITTTTGGTFDTSNAVIPHYHHHDDTDNDVVRINVKMDYHQYINSDVGSSINVSTATVDTATSSAGGGAIHAYDDDADDDDDDDDDDDENYYHHEQPVLLHTMSDDIPLEELFAYAQRRQHHVQGHDDVGGTVVGGAAVTVINNGDDKVDGDDDYDDQQPRAIPATTHATPITTVQLEHGPNNDGPRDIEVHLDESRFYGNGDDGNHDNNNENDDDEDDDDDDPTSTTNDSALSMGGITAASTAASTTAAVVAGYDTDGAGPTSSTGTTVGQDSDKTWEGPPPPPPPDEDITSREMPTESITPEDGMEQGMTMMMAKDDDNDDSNNNGTDGAQPPSSSSPTDLPPTVPLWVDDKSSSSKRPTMASSSTDGRPYRLYAVRALVVIAVLIIVIVSAVTISNRNNNTTGSTDNNNTDSPTGVSPVPPPTSTSSPTNDDDGNLTTDFVQSSVFVGDNGGDRFGTVVSMTGAGDVMAVLSLQRTEPVRTFRLMEDGLGWIPWLNLPPPTFPSSSSSSSRIDDVDTATTVDGTPVVAVSSSGGVQVHQYDDDSGAWTDRGQPLLWLMPDEDTIVQSTVSRTAVSLSSDGSILASGYVNQNGDAIIVWIYTFDSSSNSQQQQWNQLGGPISRFQPSSSVSPFLSLSLALSGDGRVVTIGDWVIGEDIQVKSYQMVDNVWTVMGTALTYDWGPMEVALSYDGRILAVTAPAPGVSIVYEWNGIQWTKLGDTFPGGSSVAMNRVGLRVLIGDPLFSTATVMDYAVDDGWTATATLTGTVLSRYGTSVSISNNGNTLAIGSPLEDKSGDDSGQVTIYD